MFAVKGWAVDPTSLKSQTEPFKFAEETGIRSQSRKRKRGQSRQVESDGLELQRDKHVASMELAKAKSKPEHQPGKQMNDSEQQYKNGVQDTGRTTDALNGTKAEKRYKKKKGDRSEEVVRDTLLRRQNDQHDGHSRKPSAAVLPASNETNLTPMQSAMRQKLTSARFRHLNERLYTEPSSTARKLFDQNPEMFDDYHAGFRQQVSVWPENPVDGFLATLRTRGRAKPPKQRVKKPKVQAMQTPSVQDVPALPRTQGTCTVADLGCGDARIAHTLHDTSAAHNLNVRILSYDLHSLSSYVTKADISDLPLKEGSINVAIFCLALMGSNWISFVEEAYRILHWKGELWVAEIKSRFGKVGKAGKPVEHSVGSKKKQAAFKKAQEAQRKEAVDVDEHTVLRTEVDGVEIKSGETDVSAFVDVLRKRGFVLKSGDKSIDLSNKMFVRMEFIKAATPTKGKGAIDASAKAPTTVTPVKKKFIDDSEDSIATDDEAKVLKPCLYKIR